MDPHSELKTFSQCAVCGTTENVHSMHVVINNVDMMTGVCGKATCRGTAHRNAASIDVTKTAHVPTHLQHVAKLRAQRRQLMAQYTATAHAESVKKPAITNAAAQHKSIASIPHVQHSKPHATDAPARKHAVRPAPANRHN
jgi:hypothetical protein